VDVLGALIKIREQHVPELKAQVQSLFKSDRSDYGKL
jgi:hypothetical protein